jgi:hypothetical protein
VREQSLLQDGDAHEPRAHRAIDQRPVAAPAMRIVVDVLGLLEQQAVLVQPQHDLGRRLEDARAGEVGHVAGEGPVVQNRLRPRNARFWKRCAAAASRPPSCRTHPGAVQPARGARSWLATGCSTRSMPRCFAWMSGGVNLIARRLIEPYRCLKWRRPQMRSSWATTTDGTSLVLRTPVSVRFFSSRLCRSHGATILRFRILLASLRC